MVTLPQIPTSKTLGFLFFGVVLYLGSVYMNILKPDSAVAGINLSYIIIGIGIFAQCMNWYIFWYKKAHD